MTEVTATLERSPDQEARDVSSMDETAYQKWEKENLPWRFRAKTKINELFGPLRGRAAEKRKHKLEKLGFTAYTENELQDKPLNEQPETASLSDRDGKLGVSVEYPDEFKSDGTHPIWEKTTFNGMKVRMPNMENLKKYHEKVVQTYDKSWEGKRFGEIRRKLQQPRYIKDKRKLVNRAVPYTLLK